MKKYLMLSLLAATVLFGCAVNYKNIHEQTSVQLCQFLNGYQNPYRRLEISRQGIADILVERGFISEESSKFVANGQVFIGMKAHDMQCAMGTYYSTKNRTQNRYGTRTQYVFVKGQAKRVYVYTENGVVTGWQD